MPDSVMLSIWSLGFRVVKLQTSQHPHCSEILVLEFKKHKQTLRIIYTIVIPRRKVPAVRIGLLYSNIITLHNVCAVHWGVCVCVQCNGGCSVH